MMLIKERTETGELIGCQFDVQTGPAITQTAPARTKNYHGTS